MKGIQMVRRDNCPLVKDVSSAVLNAIMYDKNTEAALAAARRHILDLLTNKHPIDKFVVSKALRSDYKNTQQPHLWVSKKLAQRRGYPVPSGTRVPYVYVTSDDPDCPQSEKAEDPTYVAENGLTVDALFYLDHQVWSPVCALLEVVVPNPEAAVLGHEDVRPTLEAMRQCAARVLQTQKRIKKNTLNRQHEITKFFAKA